MKETDISKLNCLAVEYFRANAMFLPTSVNPTIWIIGHVLPVHVKQVFNAYGQGFLTVTMEGREAKHVALQRLSFDTTYQKRWQEVFRHEFIMLIWLPSKSVYISSRVFDDACCYCGLQKADQTDSGCSFCTDPLLTLIH